jgi:hypothetical protein
VTDPLKRAWALIPMPCNLHDSEGQTPCRVVRVLVRRRARQRDMDLSHAQAYECWVEDDHATRRIPSGDLYRTKAEATKAARIINKWAIIALRRREESRRREADRTRIAHEKIKATLHAAIQFIKEHKP